MEVATTPFVILKKVLTDSDILFLKSACKEQLQTLGIPCFSLLDKLRHPTCLRIIKRIEDEVADRLNYLNDFYFYTDSTFSADWHMDTELYTFKDALNAWILLSPEAVSSPLEIINSINETDERYYHTVERRDGELDFSNLYNGESETLKKDELGAMTLQAPNVEVGDILLFNPRKFHKTNTPDQKHCLVIKFVPGVLRESLSSMQVSEMFWPEVGVFNKLLTGAGSWSEVLERMHVALQDEKSRAILSSGFFPDRFSFYKTASEAL